MCKLEHYGNCDPETKDQEYCIFHKPNKTEEEAKEFWRKFLERFKPKRDGNKFIFEKEVDCSEFVFPEVPNDMFFTFRRAIFKEWVSFSSAKFEIATFTEAKFENDAILKKAKFDRAYFENAKFEKDADFSGCELKEALFRNTIFKGDADFSGAIIGSADFVGDGKAKTIDERNPQELYPDDSQYKFYGELNFRGAVVDRIDIELPSERFRLPQAEAEACRVQRIWYEEEGNKDKADEMFVRERRALRRAKIRQAEEKLKNSKGVKSKLNARWNQFKAYASASIEFLLADLTCEYGTNWIKPIVSWITVLILCSLIYRLTNSVVSNDVSKVNDFLSCLYFSIVTATTLGYGDLHPIGVGRALASAEAIFGTFMWAVFLAVFARKYMR